jgi:hypothetical protein
MTTFEIKVNGEDRFVGEGVCAITLATDRLTHPKSDRVSLLVGVGEAADYEVQYLGAELAPAESDGD